MADVDQEVTDDDAVPAQAVPQRIAVIGAGLMGAGIAQTAAQAGMEVSLYDISDGALERGLDQARESAERQARAGAIAENVAVVVSRIRPTLDLVEALAKPELVVEAIPEQLTLKLEVFGELDRLAPESCILGTNTSQFSITDLSLATRRPQVVVGLHFFNPPPVMALVEVIAGAHTSLATLDVAIAWCQALGKETVVARDVQGFIASRGSLAFQLEAYRMLEEGVASADDIDRTFRLGFGHPMGPLELADYVGLDTVLNASDAMAEAHGARFRAPQVLRTLVAAGHTGRKSGRGFYDYADANSSLRG